MSASYFSSTVAHRGDATPWDAIIDADATQYGIEPALVRAVIAAESAWNPQAVSGTGSSYGLMQLNIAAQGITADFAFNPAAAVGFGARVLADQLRRLGDVSLALAAYNAGTSRSAADLTARIAGNVNGVGDYVTTVLDYLGYYRGLASLASSPPVPPDAGGGGAVPGELGGDVLAGGDLGPAPGSNLATWGILGAVGLGILAILAATR
jgi:soluble lytic murein transglycosylase-like protein